MISGLAGVAIWTDRVRDLAAFYRDVVGLRLHSDHGDYVAFDVGPGLRLNIGSHDRVQGSSRDPYRVMVHLSTTSIRADYARMLAAGVAFLRMPERESWGGWIATFQDPDGNMVQLLQLSEGANQAPPKG